MLMKYDVDFEDTVLIHLRRLLLGLALLAAAQASHAVEELATAHLPNGDTVPYILDHHDAPPSYVVILFVGGTGKVEPRMEDGRLTYRAKGNFLMRSRRHLVDDDFAAAIPDATASEERMQALLDDLKVRLPAAQVYLMGTSRGTIDTMALAPYLSDRIAGEIHTSSMQGIAVFDSRKYHNRHLVVHHRNDNCRVTPFGSAQWTHDHHATDFIAMEGGLSQGDPCEAFAHHGYNGIEKETIDAIKDWIRRGPGPSGR